MLKGKIYGKMKRRSDYLEIGDDVKSSRLVPDVEHESRSTLVRVIFYFIGMTLMFPYMMLITVTDFWNYKFRNTSMPWNASASVLTEKQTQFPGYLAITGNVPLALFVILTAIFGYKVCKLIPGKRQQFKYHQVALHSDSSQDEAAVVCCGNVPVLHCNPGYSEPQH